MMLQIFMLLSLLAVGKSKTVIPDGAPETVTQQGLIQGAWFNEPGYSIECAMFKGVPFAQPPVGELRFASPLSPKPYRDGVMAATEFSPGCMQHCGLPHSEFSCPKTYSEDCLYLNVYSPRTAFLNQTEGPLAVLFFMHGGNYVEGAGGVNLYNGARWAYEQNVVIVTINYRLGAFGGLVTESGLKGNFHLQDQRQAMRWVKENIRAFGGDPNSVTIFGQSAGGWSVATHLASPASWGLFHRAIVQSDPYSLPSQDPEYGPKLGGVFLDKLNCTQSPLADMLHCLRSEKTAAELLSASYSSNYSPLPWIFLNQFMPWVPAISPNDSDLPLSPLVASQTGAFARVPIMVGTTSNESIPWIWGATDGPLSKLEYEAFVTYIFGEKLAEGIFRLYGPPPANETKKHDVRYFLSIMATDYIFACSTRWAAKSYAEFVPVYKYLYSHLNSFQTYLLNNSWPECDDYVCHESELPLEWNMNFLSPDPNTPHPTEEESVLAHQMQTAWANFAQTGNPNLPSSLPVQPGQPPLAFPRFNYNHPELLSFDTPSKVMKEYRKKYCDWMDQYGYVRR